MRLSQFMPEFSTAAFLNLEAQEDVIIGFNPAAIARIASIDDCHCRLTNEQVGVPDTLTGVRDSEKVTVAIVASESVRS